LDKPRKLQLDNGSSLAYHHRQGATPGVLFFPGFNSNMCGNKALALDAWSEEHGIQFTRFDYFGHGASSGSLEEGSIGRWRDDALTVLHAITEGPQLLVGSSMGGWIMLLAALARPERVVGLVGIAAAPDFTERLREQRLQPQQLTQLAATGFCDMPNRYDDGEPYRISQYLLDESRQHLLLNDKISLTVPARLIHGQRDEDVPWQHALRIAEQLQSVNVEIQLVKSGDHRMSEPQDIKRLLHTIGELRQSIVHDDSL
jgi:pimeloyl-ACP methyl ester carboxylesterase